MSAPTDGVDRPTIYATAAICYFAAVLVHEAVGHAGATMLLGGHVRQITSATCDCDTSALSPWSARMVFAGGCIANVVTGFVALMIGSRISRAHALARYGAWLFGHLSLFVATGYTMVFPFLPAGDWHDFVGGLSAPTAWKLGLTVAGVAGYAGTMHHAQRGLRQFLGGASARRALVRDLTLVPYLIGGAIETLSSVAGGGGVLTFISAMPATFGGTIGLPFSGLRAGRRVALEDAPPVLVPRAPGVIAAGIIAAALQVVWLGPGLLRRFW